ncbi:MAG: hypothetical protein GF308_03735 [Candidatus Heimdallarchaeota archaeon]|nr:hypothetical protein [Candidatus Heimdallarchaeota archaeon]
MPFCSHCGSYVEDEVDICPFCKHTIEQEKEGKKTRSPLITDKKHFPIKGITDREAIEKVPEKKLATQPSFVTHPADTTKTEQGEPIVFHSPSLESYGLEEEEQAKRRQLQPEEQQQLPKLPIRDYWKWLLIGIFTFGLGFLVYLYITLADLEQLAKYPTEPKSQPIEVNVTSYLLLFFVSICFGFIPILWWIYYKKYASLYYNLKNLGQQKAPHKSFHPAIYLTPIVLSHLWAIIPNILLLITGENFFSSYPAIYWIFVSILLILSIIILGLDYFWQRAYNSRAKRLMQQFGIPLEQER